MIVLVIMLFPQLQEQRAEERQQEQEASEKLIKQLQEEERKTLAEMEEIEKQDEQLAKKLSQVELHEPCEKEALYETQNGSGNYNRKEVTMSFRILVAIRQARIVN